jgi:hypothetical protein
MVAGEWVVRDRRLVRADEDELAALAHAEAARLWRRLEQTEVHRSELEGARR